jgi:hypothetical protein
MLPLEPQPQPFLALVIFQVGSCVFGQDWPQAMVLLLAIARITEVHHYTQCVCWDRMSLTSLPFQNGLQLFFSQSSFPG